MNTKRASLIRPYETRDLQQAVDIWFGSWTATFPWLAPPWPYEGWRSRFVAKLAEGATVFIAEESGQVVGFALLFENIGRLDQLFVRPDAQSRGIGTALLNITKARCPRRRTTPPSAGAVRAFGASLAWGGEALKLHRAPASPRDTTLGGSNEALTPGDAPFGKSEQALNGKNRVAEREGPGPDAKDRVLEREGPVLDAEDRIPEREGPVLDAEDRIPEREGPVLDAEDRILEREGPGLEAEDRIREREGPTSERQGWGLEAQRRASLSS